MEAGAVRDEVEWEAGWGSAQLGLSFRTLGGP